MNGLVGLPWLLVGTINALISGAISFACYQIGMFISVSYPTLWMLPIIANVLAFINGVYAFGALCIALVGLFLVLVGLISVVVGRD